MSSAKDLGVPQGMFSGTLSQWAKAYKRGFAVIFLYDSFHFWTRCTGFWLKFH